MKNVTNIKPHHRFLFDIIVVIMVTLIGVKLLFPDILKPSQYNIYINTDGESVQATVTEGVEPNEE